VDHDANDDLLVYYSPPFMGPLEGNLTPSQLRDYYEAMYCLETMMKDPTYLYEYRLKPGECVVFMNRRVLHGRRAFDGTKGRRHLKGTYVDWDVFRDCLHVKGQQK